MLRAEVHSGCSGGSGTRAGKVFVRTGTCGCRTLKQENRPAPAITVGVRQDNDVLKRIHINLPAFLGHLLPLQRTDRRAGTSGYAPPGFRGILYFQIGTPTWLTGDCTTYVLWPEEAHQIRIR
jgi:hypothetical protein